MADIPALLSKAHEALCDSNGERARCKHGEYIEALQIPCNHCLELTDSYEYRFCIMHYAKRPIPFGNDLHAILIECEIRSSALSLLAALHLDSADQAQVFSLLRMRTTPACAA